MTLNFSVPPLQPSNPIIQIKFCFGRTSSIFLPLDTQFDKWGFPFGTLAPCICIRFIKWAKVSIKKRNDTKAFTRENKPHSENKDNHLATSILLTTLLAKYLFSSFSICWHETFSPGFRSYMKEKGWGNICRGFSPPVTKSETCFPATCTTTLCRLSGFFKPPFSKFSQASSDHQLLQFKERD